MQHCITNLFHTHQLCIKKANLVLCTINNAIYLATIRICIHALFKLTLDGTCCITSRVRERGGQAGNLSGAPKIILYSKQFICIIVENKLKWDWSKFLSFEYSTATSGIFQLSLSKVFTYATPLLGFMVLGFCGSCCNQTPENPPCYSGFFVSWDFCQILRKMK